MGRCQGQCRRFAANVRPIIEEITPREKHAVRVQNRPSGGLLRDRRPGCDLQATSGRNVACSWTKGSFSAQASSPHTWPARFTIR